MIVHELSSARHKPIIAAAASKRAVAIWNGETGERLTEMDTVYGFGGGRLALSPDGTCCVAADYSKFGVACYAALDGRVRWHRRDVRHVQTKQ